MTGAARGVRAAGSALLIVLAVSGTAVSAAQAAPEFTAVETVGAEHAVAFALHPNILGEATIAQFFSPSSVEGFILKCTSASFSGSMEPGIGTELTVTPGYGGAAHRADAVEDVRINGCDHKYVVEAKVAADLYKGSLEIACPAGKSIEIETTAAGAKRRCLDTIPAQVGIGPISFQDMTKGSPTDLTIIRKQITSQTSRTIPCCPAK